MTENTCFRCNCELSSPIEKYANYVIGTDTNGTEYQEQSYGMMHTEQTLERLEAAADRLDKDKQTVAAEMAHPGAPKEVEVSNGTKIEERKGGTVETADTEMIEFSIPENYFEHVRIETPEIVKTDDQIAFAYTIKEEKEVEKTGLICSDCLQNDDEIIWGVDE